MISRGILRGLRLYSTTGEAKDLALFLSDLMKRVDSIAARSDALKAKQDKLKAASPKNSVDKRQARHQKIEVKDHPLSRTRFNNTRSSNYKSSEGGNDTNRPQKRLFQPREGGQRTFRPSNSNQGPRTDSATESRPRQNFRPRNDSAPNTERKVGNADRRTRFSDAKPSDSGPRARAYESGPRKTDARPRNSDSRSRNPDSRPSRQSPSTDGARRSGPRSFANRNTGTRLKFYSEREIESKQIQALPYKPSITGDTFFYGKSAGSTFDVSSRVSAVAKEALLQSHYPYKLPKLIIDSVKPGINGNRFLLQKNWNLNINQPQFETRMKEVVKGEVEELVKHKQPGSKSVAKTTKIAAQTIMLNGTYTFAQKQLVVDAASGFVSPKSLLKDAHWVK